MTGIPLPAEVITMLTAVSAVIVYVLTNMRGKRADKNLGFGPWSVGAETVLRNLRQEVDRLTLALEESNAQKSALVEQVNALTSEVHALRAELEDIRAVAQGDHESLGAHRKATEARRPGGTPGDAGSAPAP